MQVEISHSFVAPVLVSQSDIVELSTMLLLKTQNLNTFVIANLSTNTV
jgi:hypothetical protein